MVCVTQQRDDDNQKFPKQEKKREKPKSCVSSKSNQKKKEKKKNCYQSSKHKKGEKNEKRHCDDAPKKKKLDMITSWILHKN